MDTPIINIGLMTQKAIAIIFDKEYVHTETGMFLSGEQRALWINGRIAYNGKFYQELFFEPTVPEASFDLKAVTINADSHWRRQEEQRFRGALNLVATDEGIVAINQIEIEDYLTSVLSSEMEANTYKEFLKSCTIVLRSRLLARMETNFARWRDDDKHPLFDVSADERGLTYRGITNAFNPVAVEAVQETRGEILVDDNDSIRDAYSLTEAMDMAMKGHTYLDIIAYYFPNASIERRY